MSQGIFAACSKLERMIEAISPKTDVHHGFTAINARTGGRVAPLEARQHTNRSFELRFAGFAMEDGAAGLSGRRRAPLLLRVKYEVPAEEHYLERLINEDAALLLRALKGPDYELATSGIVSLIPGEPTAEPMVDPTTEAHFIILSFPFDLLYLEA
jgi:hypothetical protein